MLRRVMRVERHRHKSGPKGGREARIVRNVQEPVSDRSAGACSGVGEVVGVAAVV